MLGAALAEGLFEKIARIRALSIGTNHVALRLQPGMNESVEEAVDAAAMTRSNRVL